jgi:hypothetical protein
MKVLILLLLCSLPNTVCAQLDVFKILGKWDAHTLKIRSGFKEEKSHKPFSFEFRNDQRLLIFDQDGDVVFTGTWDYVVRRTLVAREPDAYDSNIYLKIDGGFNELHMHPGDEWSIEVTNKQLRLTTDKNEKRYIIKMKSAI